MLTSRKSSVLKANEAAEKARLDAEVAARKRKLEEQSKWEGELCCYIFISHALTAFSYVRAGIVRTASANATYLSSLFSVYHVLTLQNGGRSASVVGVTIIKRQRRRR